MVFLKIDDSTIARKNQGTENAKFLFGKNLSVLHTEEGAGNLTSRIRRDQIRIIFKKCFLSMYIQLLKPLINLRLS